MLVVVLLLLAWLFDSWDDMINNYLLGYRYWCGEESKDFLSLYALFLQGYINKKLYYY